MKKKLFALSGVFLIVLVITGLWATKAFDLMEALPQTGDPGAATSTAAGLSMQEMAEGASLIVIGKCLETRSEWVERRLFTRATVSVDETLKGNEASEVNVVLPGGIDPNRKIPVAMTYAGAPRISREEKVVLFLTPEGEIPDSYVVMGFAQGKYSVVEGDAGQEFVTRDQTRAPMQKSVGVTRGNLQAVPLSEFKELVMSYLNK